MLCRFLGAEEEGPPDKDSIAGSIEDRDHGTVNVSAQEGLDRMMRFVQSASGYAYFFC